MEAYPNFHPLWIERELQRCQEVIEIYRTQLHFPNDDIVDISPWLTRCQKKITLRANELHAISVFILTCDRVKKYLAAADGKYAQLHDLQKALQEHGRLRKVLMDVFPAKEKYTIMQVKNWLVYVGPVLKWLGI